MRAYDHINRARDAALELSRQASLVLNSQRSGKGLPPAIYRKHINAIRAIVWCAINDLGQAKRSAVRAQIRSRKSVVTKESQ